MINRRLFINDLQKQIQLLSYSLSNKNICIFGEKSNIMSECVDNLLHNNKKINIISHNPIQFENQKVNNMLYRNVNIYKEIKKHQTVLFLDNKHINMYNILHIVELCIYFNLHRFIFLSTLSIQHDMNKICEIENIIYNIYKQKKKMNYTIIRSGRIIHLNIMKKVSQINFEENGHNKGFISCKNLANICTNCIDIPSAAGKTISVHYKNPIFKIL